MYKLRVERMMKEMLKNLRKYTLLITAAVFILTGCNPNNAGDNQQQGAGVYNTENGGVNVTNNARGMVQGDQQQNNTSMQNNTNMQNRNKEAREVANRLVKLATKIDQVNDATAVVAGRWAIVGIDVDATLDRSKVGTIKYTVAEALKEDPKGAHAIVTADADTVYRLRQMATGIRDGKPIEGFMDEVAAIVGRLMPQVPKDIEAPNKNAQDNNNVQKQLNEK
jgi:YhcN/YlaJ family sporulation lipoprotein